MLNEQLEVLAIIPARGGSKRIPRKNIIDLCGKPLIAYSIEMALKTPYVSRVIVSTEDREIADVAEAFGATVPFFRPKDIAGDDSIIGDAVSFTLDRLKESGYHPDVVFELYPTSVFRTSRQVKFLIEKLIYGFSYVRTVKSIPVHHYSFLSMSNDGKLLPAKPPTNKSASVPNRVCFKGIGLFAGQNGNLRESSGIYLHNIANPISLIDIDDYGDLYLAKEIIKRKLFDFEF